MLKMVETDLVSYLYKNVSKYQVNNTYNFVASHWLITPPLVLLLLLLGFHQLLAK